MDADTEKTIAFTADPNYSGKNLPAWFLMNTFLQKKLGRTIHFQPLNDFDSSRSEVLSGHYDLVYANPFDWVQYREKLGFIPMVKPKDHFDEVYLCTSASSGIADPSGLPDRIRIASAHPSTLVHMVGLFLMDKAGVDRARLDFTFTGSYQSAVKAVLTAKVDVGFVFNELYDSSSRITKDGLRIITQSDDAFAFHAFCISPSISDLQSDLTDVLAKMDTLEDGKTILTDMGFKGFERVSDDEIDCLSMLANEYISGHEALDIRATSSLNVDDNVFVVAREDNTDT